jgi:hypothetical protein
MGALVLGMSRYTVSTLPRLARTLAGWLGLPGNRDEAFALLVRPYAFFE